MFFLNSCDSSFWTLPVHKTQRWNILSSHFLKLRKLQMWTPAVLQAATVAASRHDISFLLPLHCVRTLFTHTQFLFFFSRTYQPKQGRVSYFLSLPPPPPTPHPRRFLLLLITATPRPSRTTTRSCAVSVYWVQKTFVFSSGCCPCLSLCSWTITIILSGGGGGGCCWRASGLFYGVIRAGRSWLLVRPSFAMR